MTADYLNLNHCIIPPSRIQQHHHVSVYIDCCFACFYSIPCTFVDWNNQKMFLICSATPRLLLPAVSPLPSDPLMLSLFLTGSDLLSNTFHQPTPTTHADLSQQTPALLFFPFSRLLSSSAMVEHHSFFNLCFLCLRLISSSGSLWSALKPRAVLSVLACPLVVCYSIVCLFPCFGCRALACLFFSFVCSDILRWLDAEKTWGLMHFTNIFNFQIYISGSSRALFRCCFSANI